MKNYLIVLGLWFTSMFFSGCKKLVEVDGPETSISSKNVFDNNATAIGAITSLYTNLSSGGLTDPAELTSLSCIASLSADDLAYYDLAGNNTLGFYYQNALTNSNSGGGGYWGRTYQRIYLVNTAIEEISASTKLNPNVKQQLLGEARFMRAFYYFYLVNLYGDIPLVLSTDYKVNDLITKSSRPLIYQQIITDLKGAQNLLNDKYLNSDALTAYVNGAEERVRPTKWAAIALLARAYLFLGQWTDAEESASSIISNTTQYQLTSVNQVFLKNNKETIWALQPVLFGYNTVDASIFVIPAEGPGELNPVFLNEDLMEDFESNDLRKTNWTEKIVANGETYYYPYKYKVIRSNNSSAPVTEYNIVMRLAEQYLIRSEAKARQGNLSGAISDLDKIRERAGLMLIKDTNPNIGKERLIDLIVTEKRAEFFTEWGHRWLDLKRTGKVDEVMAIMTLKKGNNSGWKSYQQYYPITLDELKLNPSLTPTPGY